MPIKQDSRSIAITTPLGPDVLGLRSFSVQEQIGRLFLIEAELSSENFEVDLDEVVGHNVTIRLQVGQKDTRYFNGVVSRLVQVASHGTYAHYRATIVPWLWLLTRNSDCRVWVAVEEPAKGKTVPEIIEAVFKLHGFNDYKLSLTGTYPKREFIVQYRETDFNFVSRLMEQEGIYYFFQHEAGKHTLVLSDSISAHKPFPGYEEILFREAQQSASVREVISNWTIEKDVQPVATALSEFDFKKPKTLLRSVTNVSRKHGAAQYEFFDYPGEYIESAEGDKLVQVRLDELQSQYEVLHGQASARGMAAGCVFKLKKHPRDDQNRDYLVTSVSLHADAGEFGAQNSGTSSADFFSCNIACIDKTQQFRPTRLTPKPIVQGVQTAFVTGPAGQEIYVDKYGRVKVQFHWDRYGKNDENSSCWVRVSQSWTGKGWGHIANPHMGEEVIVGFLEGDPDRPIIVGRVYNEDHMPPYPLPAGAAIIGMKTPSTTTTSSYKVASKK
jgi:type VI secretion system secreted protein VgrG